MKMTCTKLTGRVRLLAGLTLLSTFAWVSGYAQAASKVEPTPDTRPLQTFYLANQTGGGATEVLTGLRLMLPPNVKIFLVPEENAILMRGTSDELLMAQKILADLDRPKKSYRLAFTITELDMGKRIGEQHFSMVALAGQRATMKNGSKIPVVTGSYTQATATQTQMTYLDVGINLDFTLEEVAGGARLKSKIEQSSVSEEKSSMGAQDPVVRQTVLEGTSFIAVGKPLAVGSLDILGSTRHLDFQVVLEPVR